MKRALFAGLAYFGIVFAAGFVQGAARALLVAPRMGETAAVAVELPVMLAVSWWVCRKVTAWITLAGVRELLVMGASALAWLMMAEAGLTLALGGSFRTFLGALTTPAGALGFAGQVGFALIPRLQRAGRA